MSDTPDFTFVNHGSIALLAPQSDPARDWCEDHLPDDAPRHGEAYAIEPRFADPILQDLMADGYVIAA